MPENKPLPLGSITVLDLSRVLSGPFCTMMLGDLGAKVWKVEPPTGDDSRALAPPYIKGESAYYLAVNRNKLGICLDLTRPEGREIVFKMAERADVVIENFRADLKDRLGIGYGDLSKRNPRLIYCSISGFGQEGPYEKLPGLDNIFQGMAGLMEVTGRPGDAPLKVGERIADVIAGIQAAFGIMAAIHHRTMTGEGQYLDISLVDSLVAAQAPMISYYFATGEQPPKQGNSSIFTAPTEMFATADRPINVCTFNDKHWASLCEVLGLQHLLQDPRFRTNPMRVQNAKEINDLAAGVLRTKPASHWLEKMRAAAIPCGLTYTYEEVFHDPQIRRNQLLQEIDHPTVGRHKTIGIPVRFHQNPGRIRRPAPLLGEHTREILAEIGYGAGEIEALVEKKIIIQAK